MALFRRFFHQKPPDRLLEISDRIYVFDCCFSTDVLDESEYKPYMDRIVEQLQCHYPESSFMVFNFREGDKKTQISDILSDYDMTVTEYPMQYENCPLLPMEMIHHFLKSSDSWLSLKGQQNVLLMHCERGGWPVLAFLLAALLLYRKQYSWEQKTLEMISKQAPKELIRLLSPLNPQASQLRYLQYISRRNAGLNWPPSDMPLVLDSLILKVLPVMDEGKRCRPVVRVYGHDPLYKRNTGPKLLFSSLKARRRVSHYPEMELVKLVIGCGVQGDVVLECVHLRHDSVREEMMFRVMFHTAFVHSHNITFTRDEVDLLWDTEDKFPKDFTAEVLFLDVGDVPYDINMNLESADESDSDAASVERYYEVEEIFSNIVDGTDGKRVSDPPISRECSSDELRQKHEATGLNPSALKDFCFDNGKQKPDPKPEHAIKVVKEINLEKGNGKSAVQVEADMSSVNDTDEKRHSFDTCKEDGDIMAEAKSSPRSPPVKMAVDVVRHKADKLLQFVTRRPSTFNQNSDAQADGSGKLTKKKTAEHKWIPTNKGSLSNSKHVVYPHQRVIPPSESSTRNQLKDSPGVERLKSRASIKEEKLEGGLESAEVDSTTGIKQELALSPLSPARTPTLTDDGAALTTNVQQSPPPPAPPPPLKETTTEKPPELQERSQISSVVPLEKRAPSSHVIESATPTQVPSVTVTETCPSCGAPLPSVSACNRKLPIGSETSSQPPPNPPPPPPQHPSPPLPPGGCSQPSTPQPPPPPPPRGGGGPPPPPPPMKGGAPPPPPPLKGGAPPPPPPMKGGAPGPPAPPRPPGGGPPPPPPGHGGGPPAPPPGEPKGGLGARGRLTRSAPITTAAAPRKQLLKPLHWSKVTRVAKGTLWDELQGRTQIEGEINVSEIESLFSTIAAKPAESAKKKAAPKSEVIHLVDLRRANNTEIMLTKVKMPLPDMVVAALAMDESVLDADQVENLIKFCPTKDEMDLLKNFTGDMDKLGKCEQFFLELMKVPRVESKLRVFLFKIQFSTQVEDFRNSLTIVLSSCDEIRNSWKLKEVMRLILLLGNTLNSGTARGGACGFKLDSLLKLNETRATNSRMTLMHYLGKVLARAHPEIMDFPEDFTSLEAASKIQLKSLAEEMQTITRGLEKVKSELVASANDGNISTKFCKTLKEFIGSAETEVASVLKMYAIAGRNADTLASYFGEDPARCPFEQVAQTLLSFMKSYCKAQEENVKQAELDRKIAEKEAAEMEKSNEGSSSGKDENET